MSSTTLKGTIKAIKETEKVTDTFSKRICILEHGDMTSNYKELGPVEFVNAKTELLNDYQVGDQVEISVNIRQRRWMNPENKAVYFTTLNGWRISKTGSSNGQPEPVAETVTAQPMDSEPDDLPF